MPQAIGTDLRRSQFLLRMARYTEQDSYSVWGPVGSMRLSMEIRICELHNQECTLGLEEQGIWRGREGLAVRRQQNGTTRQPQAGRFYGETFHGCTQE